ncbi:hypothetical protein SAMN05216428_109110 [Nitrosospira sp. Nsp11]|uniref:hypothetical protein n=1 Tax=Nitrosospira sp. Nsp11 TaxID=1855338 RepID=UPI000919FE96|nr:hypothetical protein [Nitrosospira sp. Nsp11]SHL94201.1 hypothetical protein SAMN05216428_109110 [Nitrosospira sp. Nsp11]
MIQKRKMESIIAIVPFLMATVSFATSANASEHEGGSDASVMKREPDGSVSKKEFMKHHEWMFDQNDKNHNAKLEPDEMRNLHKMVSKMHGRFEQEYGQKK